MARLDYYRVLEDYKDVFDLSLWFEQKIKFIENLDINDPFQLEIYELFNPNKQNIIIEKVQNSLPDEHIA